uniref:BZIP domain-containing protein n=1 Tax=Oryza nivara TaxID=4536 RepID=A0A0E0IP62_ORYNI
MRREGGGGGEARRRWRRRRAAAGCGGGGERGGRGGKRGGSGDQPPEREAEADADERRFRRKISNRESACRSRAHKQWHLDELRARAGWLRRCNCELAARGHAARGRAGLVHLTNMQLRAKAATPAAPFPACR